MANNSLTNTNVAGVNVWKNWQPPLYITVDHKNSYSARRVILEKTGAVRQA
jgi:hypothetical protein